MQQGRERSDSARAHFAPLGLWLSLLMCLAAVFQPQSVSAASSAFDIKTPYLSAADGVYTLHAQLMFSVPEGPAKAVREGATLNLNLNVKFDRVRHWWTNETVAELEQRYELVYHSVSERYVVRNVNSGAQTSFASFDDAIESLKDVDGLPLLDTALLTPDQEYEVNVRGSVEVRTIPRALGMLLFWVDDFSLHSEWYTWPLKP